MKIYKEKDEFFLGTRIGSVWNPKGKDLCKLTVEMSCDSEIEPEIIVLQFKYLLLGLFPRKTVDQLFAEGL